MTPGNGPSQCTREEPPEVKELSVQVSDRPHQGGEPDDPEKRCNDPARPVLPDPDKEQKQAGEAAADSPRKKRGDRNAAAPPRFAIGDGFHPEWQGLVVLHHLRTYRILFAATLDLSGWRRWAPPLP